MNCVRNDGVNRGQGTPPKCFCVRRLAQLVFLSAVGTTPAIYFDAATLQDIVFVTTFKYYFDVCENGCHLEIVEPKILQQEVETRNTKSGAISPYFVVLFRTVLQALYI